MKMYNEPIYLINNQKQIRFCTNSNQFEQLKLQGFKYLKRNTKEFKDYKKDLRNKKEKYQAKLKELKLWNNREYISQRKTMQKEYSFNRLTNETYSQTAEGKPRIKKTKKEGI